MEGYEGLYEVHPDGVVRSLDRTIQLRGRWGEESRVLKGRALKPLRHTSGYKVACLWKEGYVKKYYIHDIVLRAFVGPRPAGCQAAHWDGVKTNNRLSNLRWASPKENQADRVRHGTSGRGVGRYCDWIGADGASAMREAYEASGLSISAFARSINRQRTTVADIVRRRTWRK